MGLEQGSLISGGGGGEGSHKRKFILLYGDVLMLIIVWDKTDNQRLSSEMHIMIMSFSNRSELWSWYIA